MERHAAFLSLVAGAVTAATALAVPPERDYEGRIERDPRSPAF